MGKYIMKCKDSEGVFYVGADIRNGYKAELKQENAQVFEDRGTAYRNVKNFYTNLEIEKIDL